VFVAVIVAVRPVIAIAQRSCAKITAKRIRMIVSSMRRDFASPSIIQSGADGLAVAVVLTLELADIALVLGPFDHVVCRIVNANHSIM
jgi:hypothetical protein